MPIKKMLFYVIALLIPFLMIAFFELLLRVANYGAQYPLFIESETFAGYTQTNPEVVKRFFSHAQDAPSVSPDTYIFKSKKPQNTLRIVTMGGSTMAGYPYGRFGSPAGMLQHRINATHPHLNIEVISVAMSAINSFALLDFTQEVIEIKPDAVLIYAGHNEYVGIMGASSNLAGGAGRGSKLFFLRVKEFRIYQLIANTIAYFSRTKDSSMQEQGRTLMANVAKGQHIVYGSETYHAGITQFKDNMALVLASFAEQNIPVLLSTIAANERDQKPFKSLGNDAIDNTIARIIERPARAKFLLDKAIVEQAASIHHADFMYAMGKALLADGQTRDAGAFFADALDFDLLRFRAPRAINEQIIALSDKAGVTLVDSARTLQDRAKIGGIIGNELMLEHLHPNTTGYFWIGEAFYDALMSLQILPPAKLSFSQQQALALQPVSRSEQIFAHYNIEKLLADFPFTDTPTIVPLLSPNNAVEEIALARIQGQNWIPNQQALVTVLQKQGYDVEAGIVAGNLFKALPEQTQLARVASLLFLENSIWGLAEYYGRWAVKGQTDNENYRLTLAEIYYKSGQRGLAIQELEAVLSINPKNALAAQLIKQI